MNSSLAGWLQVALLVAALAACYVPLGNWIARIFTTDKHWKVESGVYKIIGVNPDTDQKWSAYLRSMLAFSFISVLAVYGIERLQHYLLLSLGQTYGDDGRLWPWFAMWMPNLVMGAIALAAGRAAFRGSGVFAFSRG